MPAELFNWKGQSLLVSDTNAKFYLLKCCENCRTLRLTLPVRSIEYQIGKIREPAMLEIHQQEGKIIKDVDRGERVREFEAIE